MRYSRNLLVSIKLCSKNFKLGYSVLFICGSQQVEDYMDKCNMALCYEEESAMYEFHISHNLCSQTKIPTADMVKTLFF